MSALKYFLLEHDGCGGASRTTEFSDSAAAFEALSAREREKAPSDEVVLFMAESVDVLRQTHSRYFNLPSRLGLRETVGAYASWEAGLAAG